MQVRNLCYMVTKREKMRNRFLESKRDIFVHQAAILRSQSGRKLNARDYQAVINAHHQSTSVYDCPEAVIRTARNSEAIAANADDCAADGADSVSVSKATDHTKKTKMPARPRIKGHRPGQPSSALTSGTVPQRKHLQSIGNPYAKPTYHSFEWILSSRRRSSVDADDASAVKRKRRRKLFAINASSCVGERSVAGEADRTGSSSTDLGIGKLYLDVTGSSVAQSQEHSLSKSPSSSCVNSQQLVDGKGRQDFTRNASPQKHVVVNGTLGEDYDLVSQFPPADSVRQPCSSTPLKRSPLHSFEETQIANHTLASQSSPRFNVSKLQARHFSDILVDRTSPSSKSRDRTTSHNDEDAYVDVVSDTPVTPSTSTNSVNSQQSLRNGFADGLSRLSKVKTKKHLAVGGLVNGLRQRTLDSFVRRLPNGSHCANGISGTVENGAVTENENRDFERNSLSPAKPTQTVVDRVKENGEPLTMSSEQRTADVSDNFVDMDSIEGVWRRRTSLRSSTAFMSLLGDDLAQWT